MKASEKFGWFALGVIVGVGIAFFICFFTTIGNLY